MRSLGQNRSSAAVASWTSASFALLLGLQLVLLVRWRAPYVTDDAAFFMRYAENLAAGHGYRWNVEEAPIWGASAPLWPLLVAGGILTGLTALQATIVTSLVTTLVATWVLGKTVHRLLGNLGVLALAALLPTAHLYTCWGTAGLETPLTHLVLALALFVATTRAGSIGTGLVAGLCLVHKVDVAPVGLLLLGGLARWNRRAFPRALGIAAALAFLWYGFATWHFGSPIPNSLVTKLRATFHRMPHTWFLETLFLEGAWPIRVSATIVGLISIRRHRWLLLTAGGAILCPALAYSLRPPTEPFSWYAAGISGVVGFLGAVGLAGVARWASGRGRVGTWLVPAGFLGIGSLHHTLESPLAALLHDYQLWAEPARIRAGEWVDRNLPPDVRLYTRWGHPAYASRRFTYDGSGLNRRGVDEHLIRDHRPDVLVDLFGGDLEAYRPEPGYRVVEVFRGDPVGRFNTTADALVLLRLDVRPELPGLSTGLGLREILRRLASAEALEGHQRELACSFLRNQRERLPWEELPPQVAQALRDLLEQCAAATPSKD